MKIAPVTILLALVLVAAYGLELSSGGDAVCAAWGLVPARPSFETALSSIFLHDPSGWAHIGGNVVFLIVFGGIVERSLGGARFLGLFVASGLGGCAFHCLVNHGSTTPLVGASGSLFGLLAVAGVIRPRLLGFVVAFVGLNLWYAFAGGSGEVSFGCHIGGFVIGFVAVVVMWVTDSEALEAA